LLWLDVRLGVLFALALPLVLLIWAALRHEKAMMRLLDLYWKVASLLLVAVLWFWVDLNEELADMPPWRALPLTLRIWRWGLTAYGLASAVFAATALPCLNGALERPFCQVWLEAPKGLHGLLEVVVAFVFGGSWSQGVASFLGFLGLVAYGVGLLQWLVVRLPRLGRVAGEF